jgi:RNA recognition motif-containing protein
MEIFIGNLPRYAAVSHLNRFFAGFGRIAHFRVLEKVLDDGRLVRFGHGVIEPDSAAQQAIGRLNGKRLLGCPLQVRPYVDRRAHDRRSGGARERRSAGELRAGEERRIGGRFRPAHASWR